MRLELKNSECIVGIEKKGAELASMKFVGDETEYIWTADANYWGRHAPILFPIVGKVVNGKYLVESKDYYLGQHGFARDMNFEVIKHDENQLVMRLLWNEELIKMYPYHFELQVVYTLNKSTLEIEYSVKNCDTQIIFFSIGAHPGFNCPLKSDETMEDYYFEFEVNETCEAIGLTPDGLLVRKKKPCLDKQSTLAISPELFRSDALVFDDLMSNQVSLRSKKGTHSVSVRFEGFPFLGLWSKPSGAPFVCIEPWHGHADYSDFAGDFSEKEDNRELGVGEQFSCNYSIQITR